MVWYTYPIIEPSTWPSFRVFVRSLPGHSWRRDSHFLSVGI